jgi:hypothetical protein
MKMTRYFFISDDLDDLERFEEDLERAGIVTPQIHVLTLNDTDAANHHHLHQITAFMKRDVVHSAILGAVIGLAASVLTLIVAHAAGWTATPAGWVPFIFLALVVLGFSTWQGGLWGIQRPNVRFKRFEKALANGKHVFFVDLEPDQGKILKDIVKHHPTAEAAGLDRGAPHWIVFWQHRLRRFFVETFP